MKILTTMFILGGLILSSIPMYAYAQSYGYIDTSGALQITSANSPEEAIATALNRAHDSGVMVIGGIQTGTIVPIDSNTKLYAYVSTSGLLLTVGAESPQEAISLAPNRAPHSGVMLMVK